MNEDGNTWKEKEKSAGLKTRYDKRDGKERDESRVIIGMGVDLAEVERIRGAIERHGEPFLRRVYTVAEKEYCERFKNKYERFAGRFAAKEAAMKALGTGWRRGVRWVDFEVVREKGGRPTIRLDGEARKIAEELGVKRIALSITHTEAQALAQVIFES
jgi:holo-[acyl-carrier protein] synthase